MGLFKKIGGVLKKTIDVINPVAHIKATGNAISDFAEKRQERVMERKEAKYDFKLQKQEIKTTQKALAYENGFNPTSDIWGGVSSTVQSVAQGVSSIFGKGNVSGIFGGSNNNGATAYLETNKGMIFIIIGIVVILLLSKK